MSWIYEQTRDDADALTKLDTKKLEHRIKKHLTPFFAGRKMTEISPELRHLQESQSARRDALKKAGKFPSDRGFFRMVAQSRKGEKHPKPITSFSKAFRTACRTAGCEGHTPHDLRRTAVRDFVRSGISQTVATQMTGHLTDSVFRRYDIVSSTRAA